MLPIDTLFANLAGAEYDSSDSMIAGITTDPDRCKPGFLYVACECETVDSTRFGVRLDGRLLIERAQQNGAVAVLVDKDFVVADRLLQASVFIRHPEPLSILGELCSRLLGPPYPAQVALVTGTNGKTSTVTFCRQLWALTGHPACSVGNLGGVVSDGRLIWDRDPALSVPETVMLHDMLHLCASTGVNHVAMEATSHALFDHRLTGVPASIAAFTNLTRDHLDFHLTMDEYFRVKMTLFKDVLPQGSITVINADSPWFDKARQIAESRGHRVIGYGRSAVDIRLVKSETRRDGQRLCLEIAGKSYECDFNLFGEFQVSNLLCALAIVIASGVRADQAVAAVDKIPAVEGRLELVSATASGARVIVDYAHSPDGIRAALDACRTFTAGRVFIVFGCNGERDIGKRVEMGDIASQLADTVIVTDGHPRSEDPALIRKDVLGGAPGAVEIADRKSAIAFALEQLQSGDTLLLAGLGHEKFRTIGTERVPYSDADTVRELIALDLRCKS